MKRHNDLTADYVRSILDYDPETGVFKWKWREDVGSRWNTRYAGKAAGCVQRVGYVLISINDRLYKAHRLAWLFVYGEWPPEQIDHIDCDKLNNRIANLRLATMQENQRNVGLQKNNTTGIKGVCWHKRDRKFQAEIKVGGKRLHLGTFDTLAEAIAARTTAEIEHFGPFRRSLPPTETPHDPH
jgi:hypothetical protein